MHELRYDLDAPGVDAYPDKRWPEDADTATGLGLISPLAGYPEDDPTRGFPSVFERMPTLDGFGTTVPASVRTTGAVDVREPPRRRHREGSDDLSAVARRSRRRSRSSSTSGAS